MALLLRTLAITICLSSPNYCHSHLSHFVTDMPVDNRKVTKIFEMVGACSAFGGGERGVQGFGAET